MNTTPKIGKGGKREGAGRKPGSITTRTQEIINAALSEGISPLAFMLQIMRKEPASDLDPKEYIAATMLRFEAAKWSAPYIHPRLAAFVLSGPNGESLAPPVIHLVRDADPILNKLQ